MSDGWSFYVIALTSIMFIGVVAVLFGNRTRPSSMDKTTGHSHDGIEEYDNPLPAWWFYLFIATIVFSIGYLIAFPGMGNYPGLLGWSSTDKWEREQQQAHEKFDALFASFRDVSIADLSTNTDAMKMAQRIFANNCAQCHGSDARGSYAFPDLTDNDWLYGGNPAQIKHSIQYGRQAVMPAWGDTIGEDNVLAVSHYVLSLQARASATQRITVAKDDGATKVTTTKTATTTATTTTATTATAAVSANSYDSDLAAKGASIYASYCAACHAADGSGNIALGAPNLTDDIWLYNGSLAMIQQSVRYGRNGQMPAHDGVINSDKIHLLSAYVYGLSSSSAPKSALPKKSVSFNSDAASVVSQHGRFQATEAKSIFALVKPTQSQRQKPRTVNAFHAAR